MLLCQERLGIERVHLGRAAVHVEENDIPRFWWKMRKARREGTFLRSRSAEGFIRSQAEERQAAKTIRAAEEHLAPRHRSFLKLAAMVHGS